MLTVNRRGKIFEEEEMSLRKRYFEGRPDSSQDSWKKCVWFKTYYAFHRNEFVSHFSNGFTVFHKISTETVELEGSV